MVRRGLRRLWDAAGAPLLLFLAFSLPAAALAVFALDAAGRDYEDGLRRMRAEIESEAEALRSRLHAALEDAAGRARARIDRALEALRSGQPPPVEEAVGVAAGGGAALQYAPARGGSRDREKSDAARLFALSLRGGQSWEYARGDPRRALDAYGFFIARIPEGELRDRLCYRMARAAFKAGEEALGLALLRRLAERAEPALEEDGLPVALLAAWALRERGESVDGPALLKRLGAYMSSSSLLFFAEELAPGDRALRRAVELRRLLERACATHPEVARVPGIHFSGEAVVAGKPFEGGGLILAAEPLPRIPAAGSGLESRIEPGALPAGTPAAENAARIPVRLASGGPAVATVEVRDPAYSDRIASLRKRRTLLQILVGLLIAATLGGAAFFSLFLARERRLVALRERLLANVSHELKTPVTSIRLFAEMLAADDLDGERARRYATSILRESERLDRLVASVVESAALRKGRLQVACLPVDLRGLCRSLAETFRVRAEGEGILFRTEGVSSGDPLYACGDPHAIQSVLSSLLDNAFKYRRRDGARVTLRLEEAAGTARIAVLDNGPGIPAGEREAVFEPFYRVRYEDYAVRGSGLGLAIARGLARAMGGDVVLERSEPGGTVFVLELPLETSAPAGGGGEAAAPKAAVSEKTRETS